MQEHIQASADQDVLSYLTNMSVFATKNVRLLCNDCRYNSFIWLFLVTLTEHTSNAQLLRPESGCLTKISFRCTTIMLQKVVMNIFDLNHNVPVIIHHT